MPKGVKVKIVRVTFEFTHLPSPEPEHYKDWTCNECINKATTIYIQEMAPMPRANIPEPWLFEYPLCQYHKAWNTRKKREAQQREASKCILK